jgi:hypothetical protein
MMINPNPNPRHLNQWEGRVRRKTPPKFATPDGRVDASNSLYISIILQTTMTIPNIGLHDLSNSQKQAHNSLRGTWVSIADQDVPEEEEINLQSSPKYPSFCSISTFTTQPGLNFLTVITNIIYTRVFSISYAVWTVISVKHERTEHTLK